MFSTRRLCCTSKLCVYTSVSVKSRAQIKRERTFFIAFTRGLAASPVAVSQGRGGGLYYQSVRDTGNESRESKRHYSLLVLSPLARRSRSCQHTVLVDLDVVVVH